MAGPLNDAERPHGPSWRNGYMLRCLAVLLLAALAPAAIAQENYPSRQITLIAPFAAGGSAERNVSCIARKTGVALTVVVVTVGS